MSAKVSILLWSLLFLSQQAVSQVRFRLDRPAIAGQELVLTQEDGQADSLYIHTESDTILVTIPTDEAMFSTSLPAVKRGKLHLLYLENQEWKSQELAYHSMPAWLSILPPLLAILCAMFLREVIFSLFLGILSGVFLHMHYTMPDRNLASGFFLSLSDYVLPALQDYGHLSVIVFSMLIGGLVAVISRNGGMSGLVRRISRFAKTRQSAQFSTWLLGVVIFFDDYANTLVVGNTMRPVTDKLRISREKLAYIVDSTAAPVAAIAFVTTWIGAQLGYIQDGIDQLDTLNTTPYAVFMGSLQYAFYPVFTLVFILGLIFMRRDYGAMYQAEKRIVEADEPDHSVHGSASMVELEPAEGTPFRTFNALIPVGVLVIGTIVSLLITGYSPETWSDPDTGFWKKLSATIGAADSYKALLWSSLLALILVVILTASQRILSLHQTIETAFKGFGFMLQAIAILCLAWTLSSLTEYLQTAEFISSVLQEINANPTWFPALTFILAFLVAFSTGSSWSTMAILYPMLLPAVWILGGLEAGAMQMPLFLNVVSCVLAGSVMGDHCSPISDTTILSSLSSSCDHLSHVRTQIPYALTVGTISLLVGTIPASFGISSWFLFPAGFLAIYLVIRIFGKPLG